MAAKCRAKALCQSLSCTPAVTAERGSADLQCTSISTGPWGGCARRAAGGREIMGAQSFERWIGRVLLKGAMIV